MKGVILITCKGVLKMSEEIKWIVGIFSGFVVALISGLVSAGKFYERMKNNEEKTELAHKRISEVKDDMDEVKSEIGFMKGQFTQILENQKQILEKVS
jgi:hypothetical protein